MHLYFPQSGGDCQSDRGDDGEQAEANPGNESRGAENEVHAVASDDPLREQYVTADNQKCDNRDEKARTHEGATRPVRRRQHVHTLHGTTLTKRRPGPM